jgi:anti-sigma factor (TIGR02949 family)
MSTCREAVEQLVDYLHTELDYCSEAKLQKHLQLCENCCDQLEFQQKLSQVIMEKAQVGDCPTCLKENILTKIRLLGTFEPELEKCLTT